MRIGIGLCVLGGLSAQGPAALPLDIEIALSRISELRIRVVCESRTEAVGDREEVMRRWKVGRKLFRAVQESYVIDGERFRYDRRPLGAAPVGDLSLSRRMAFDGAEVRIDNAGKLYEIWTVQGLTREYTAKATLFEDAFFAARRITVPQNAAAIGSLPFATDLRFLQGGATFELVECADGTRCRIRQTAGDTRTEVHLAKELGWAATSWTVHRGNRLVRSVNLEDFHDVGGVRMARCSTELWYSWHTVPRDVSATPLLRRTIRVVDMSSSVADAPMELDDPVKGMIVMDGRTGEHGGAKDANVEYYVQERPEEILDRYLSAFGRRGETGLLGWLTMHAAVVAAAWWLTRRRQA